MKSPAFGLSPHKISGTVWYARDDNRAVPAGKEKDVAARPFETADMPPDNGRWFQYAPLPSGWEFLRWRALAEFLVSPSGKRVWGRALRRQRISKRRRGRSASGLGRALDGARRGGQGRAASSNGRECDLSRVADTETLRSYLLPQVLSFSLLKKGIEPLHSTAVAFGGNAVGFMGDCGAGKSTLAAACVREGFRVLTDDFLLLEKRGAVQAGGRASSPPFGDASAARDEVYLAAPGFPRLKLFGETADEFFPETKSRPMNPFSSKRVIELRGSFSPRAVPLRVLYVLRAGPSVRRVVASPLSRRLGMIELVRASYNIAVTRPERLRRQFGFFSDVAATVPIKILSYPRDLSRIHEAVRRIQEDLR